MASGKKNCKKGYSCGSSCISVLKMCKKTFSEGISVSIDGMRKAIRNSISGNKLSSEVLDKKTTDNVEKFLKSNLKNKNDTLRVSEDLITLKSTLKDGTEVKLAFSRNSYTKVWTVSGAYDTTSQEAVKKYVKLYDGIVKQLPEGVVLEEPKGQGQKTMLVVEGGRAVSPTPGQQKKVEIRDFAELNKI